MKLKLTICALAAILFAIPAIAQIISTDSLHALQNQKDMIETSKQINDKKIKLAQVQKELEDKQIQMQQSAQKAQESADANKNAAKELTANPQDKKLSKKASDAANDAQRDAKNARKATGSYDSVKKEVSELQNDIQETQKELASMSGAVLFPSPVSGAATSFNRGLAQNSSSAPVSPLSVGSMPNGLSSGSTQSVLEAAYGNYPQQPGQPAIIINNIIVASDYNSQKPSWQQGRKDDISNQDLQDYEDYKVWLRYKKLQAAEPGTIMNPAPSAQSQPVYAGTENQDAKLTFKERFAEKPERNSGLWVIPMVGIHASNFKANFKDDQFQGRSGWNAGLDFRFRMRKFFIQPGVHYFSSSIDVTREDSIAAAPLLTGPRIHSLKAPLMLGVYLTKAKGGFFRFNVKGGVVGNYVLSVDRNNVDRFDKDNIEDFSYGLNAGIGLEFGFVTLDLSHEWGMSPLFKDSSQKNNVLRATLGFKL